jgi:hypothetical protein
VTLGDDAPDEADVVAQVLRRLSWTPVGTALPQVPHDRLAVRQLAMDWQQLGIMAQFLELHGFTKGAPEGRISELVGRYASCGEQLGLAWTLDQEIQRWFVAGRGEPGFAMACRALAEMCGYFLLSSAHGLANLTLRTLTLSPDADAVLRRHRPRAGGYQPFSDQRDAWPPLTRKLADETVEAARATAKSSVVSLCEVLVDLTADPAWRAIEQRRHSDYHRWRSQGLPSGGVPMRSLWTGPSPGVMELSGSTHFFERVDVNEAADAVNRALEAFANQMRAWDAAWPSAIRDLGVPLFKVEQ